MNDCIDDSTEYYITGPYSPINAPAPGLHNAVVWNHVYAGGAYMIQFYATYNLSSLFYRFCEVGVWRNWINIGSSTAHIAGPISITLPSIAPCNLCGYAYSDWNSPVTPLSVQIQEINGGQPLFVTNWWVDNNLQLVMQIMNLHPTNGFSGGNVNLNIIY